LIVPNKCRIARDNDVAIGSSVVARIHALSQRADAMNRKELEQWLGDRESRSVALDELADVLHVVLGAARRSVSFADADELNELRFAIAVLRDVFARDDEVRAWLTTPAIGGDTPADLLAAGNIRQFADLAIEEWNRPRMPRLLISRESAVRA
jgi:hypothetical protein